MTVLERSPPFPLPFRPPREAQWREIRCRGACHRGAARLHRPVRPVEDHPRRRRSRSRAARGPRSIATSTARVRSCAASSTSSSSGSRLLRSTAASGGVDTRRRGVALVTTAATRSRRARRAAVPPRARAGADPRPARVRSRRPSCSSRVGDAFAPAFARWLSDDDARRAGDWLARILRFVRADARTHRSISPTSSRRAASCRSS